MPLTAVIEPQQPSAQVWKRIEQSIGGAAASSVATNAQSPSNEGAGWWRQLAFWRAFSAVAGLATLALAVMLANPGPPQAPIIVVLSAAAAPGSPANAIVPASFVASITADGRAMVTKPIVNVSMEANRSLELWSLPPKGDPRSLGVIAADKATVVQRGKVLEGTDAFAVTLEPAGGSPSGKPTGPVLYVGKLTL
jgi:anti-sigma-K factor RskA